MTDEEIFEAVLDAEPKDRPAILDKFCAGRPDLRARIAGLLDDLEVGPNSDDSTPTFDEQAEGAVVVGRYTLIERIGEGGFGEVWVAKQSEPVRRKVALKLIRADKNSRSVVARFEQERQALALMDHPNIARVFDGGLTSSGQPYLVMELVPGRPLTKFCDEAKLGVRERLELFVQVCRAVQHAHQKGVVHRDLKPANILVTLVDGRPTPKVIDFGVAKAVSGKLTEETLSTHFGAVVGTLEYMAPEQAGVSIDDVDTRADIYALGVVLYELLTGLRPFDATRLRKAALDEIVRVIREEEPPSLSSRLSSDESLPSAAALRGVEPKRLLSLFKGELDWIVLRCLEKDRNRRYESASGLGRDVERFLNDEPVEARPVSSRYRLKKFLRRNKGSVAAAALLLLSLIVGFGGTTWGMIRAKAAEHRESLRAEGERKAKIEAQEQGERALKRLAQVERGSEILGAIFDDLDVRKVKEGSDPLEAVLAKRLLKAAEELDGDALGEPLVVAALQHRLGSSLITLGYAADGVRLLDRALKTRRALMEPDHPTTLRNLNNLASGHMHAGEVDRALSMLEEVVRLQRTKLGSNHPDALVGENNLAMAYANAGRVDRAMPMLEQLLQTSKSSLKANDPLALTIMNNLAQGYGRIGRFGDAISLLEKTVALRKAELGADHPDTYESMVALGAIYVQNQQSDKGLPMVEEAVRLRKARLGADHPDALESLDTLAMAYVNAGRLNHGVLVYEEVLAGRMAKLGPGHSRTLGSMHNLAWTYANAGQIEKALPLRERLVVAKKASQGPDHPDALMAMHNLAWDYLQAGKLDKAEPLMEEVLAGRKVKLGADHPETLYSMGNLATAYARAGKRDRALTLYEEVLAICKKKFGPDDINTFANQNNLAWAYLEGGRPEKAATILKEILAAREKKRLEDFYTFNCKRMLGQALLAQKKYAEAEPQLLQAYEGVKAHAKSVPPQTAAQTLASTADQLIELYKATNKPDLVDKWQAERKKYSVSTPPVKTK